VAEHVIRKEERILPTSDPAGAVGGEAAAGDDAMHDVTFRSGEFSPTTLGMKLAYQ
jgi:hypothetical protein